MAKNLIPEIAKMLGVEIGEEFDVNIPYMGQARYHRYKFDNKGLLLKRDGDWHYCNFLPRLVSGEFEISRLPFNPKFGDKYWTYDDLACDVIEMQWHNDWVDYKNKKLGFVFRTKNEALMERPDCYEALTGHAWMVEG